MARVSRRFVDETLWDEYEQLSTVLRRHLDEVTHRIDQRPNWQRFGVLPMQRSDDAYRLSNLSWPIRALATIAALTGVLLF